MMRLLVCMLLSMLFLLAEGQVDTLLQRDIDLITVQADRTSKSDSVLAITPTTQNISQLLSTKTNIYIKSYGLGSLATLSLWGGNASQTLIEWEGLPISNPMLGLTDLSLIPMNTGAELSLEKGGLSAEHGSGAITGLLQFSQNKLPATEQLGLTAGVGYGSFGQWNSNLDMTYRKGRFAVALSGFSSSADNDFSFESGQTEKQQTNADLSYAGLTASSTINIGEHQRIGINLWIQESEKGIPPTAVQTNSVARQEDITLRSKLFWKMDKKKYSIHSHLAILDEQNNYSDSLNLIFTNNRFQKKLHRSQFKYHEGKVLYRLSYDLDITDGFSDAYENEKQNLTNFAIYAAAEYSLSDWSIKTGLRKEWRSLGTPPLLPLISLGYNFRQVSARLKFSREYRAPTLNELFWVPGGNLDLLPEMGWNQELLLSSKNVFKAGIDLETNFFHRKIDNWILWAPLDNQLLWSPYNLGAVRSYGIDLESSKEHLIGTVLSRWAVGYNYNRSENLVELAVPEIAAGDQLIYTPKTKVYVSHSSNYKGTSLDINANYTSAVSGINEDLSSYWLLSASLSWELHLGKLKNTVSLNIENLTNSNYRVIERRPMPGRYYQLNWRINFNTLNQTNNKQ